MRSLALVLAAACGSEAPSPPPPPQAPTPSPIPKPCVRPDATTRKAAYVADLRARCDRDQASACNALSNVTRDGDGVPADAARATELMMKSCRLGDADACNRIDGAPARYARAFELALASCIADPTWSECWTASDIAHTTRVFALPRNFWRTTSGRWRDDCSGGHAHSCLALALAIDRGYATGSSSRYTRRACELGHGGACASFARGKDAPQYLQRACDLGYAYACERLAHDLADPAAIRRLLVRSCELSPNLDRDACVQALALLEAVDPSAARALFCRGADSG
jgi:TPR repeat protein